MKAERLLEMAKVIASWGPELEYHRLGALGYAVNSLVGDLLREAEARRPVVEGGVSETLEATE